MRELIGRLVSLPVARWSAGLAKLDVSQDGTATTMDVGDAQVGGAPDGGAVPQAVQAPATPVEPAVGSSAAVPSGTGSELSVSSLELELTPLQMMWLLRAAFTSYIHQSDVSGRRGVVGGEWSAC